MGNKSDDEVAICRTCVGECANYRSVHKEGMILGKTQTIACMIKYCTGLDVLPEDDLPDVICERCLQMLAKSYTFKESVLKANQKLVEEYSKPNNNSFDNDTNVELHVQIEELESQASDGDEYEEKEELEETDTNELYEELSTEEIECDEFITEEIDIVDDQIVEHVVADELEELANAAQIKRSMDDEEYLMMQDEWQTHESAGEEVGAFETQHQAGHNDDEANIVMQRLKELDQIKNEVILEETVVATSNLSDEDMQDEHDALGEIEQSEETYVSYQRAESGGDDVDLDVDVDNHGRVKVRRLNCAVGRDNIEEGDVVELANKYASDDPPPLRRKRFRIMRQPNPDWQCKQCGKQLSNSNSFKYHMQLHSDAQPFLCTLCGERFKTRNAFDGHVSMHDPNNPNTCKECGKSYRQSSSLRSHMLTHTGERPFRCGICGKGMTQKSGYKKHMLTHTGEKPYSCDVCGREFRYSSNLFAHKRCHTGERPYMCPHCDKSFTSSEQVKRHVVVHTGDRPYACEVCGRSFKRSSSLGTHRHTHSPHVKLPLLVNKKVARSKVVELY